MNQYTSIILPTETDLCTWIGQAFPGEIIEYHRGFLAMDANPALGQRAKELSLLARRAAWASDAGLVHLVQRRNGPGDFSYLAIRRPTPRTARRGKVERPATSPEDAP
jgi:hypothetical protein